MPFEPTWTREQKDYLEQAYKDDVPLAEMAKVLKRKPSAISEYASNLNLTDPGRTQRIRYKLGQCMITPEILEVIEELIIDWGYSANKIRLTLEAEYNIKVSKTGLKEAINKRVSEEARGVYRRRWSRHNKYKHPCRRKWLKKGPEYIKQQTDKYYEVHNRRPKEE